MDSKTFEPGGNRAQGLLDTPRPFHSKSYEASETFWELQMSEKILRYVRDDLYLEMRFLGTALSSLAYRPDKRLLTMATDGETLFYSAEQLFRLFQENPAYLDRIYLHSVLHCLFSHLWLAGNRNPALWGIACDIAVEYTIDHMGYRCTRRILTLTRTRVYDILDGKSSPVRNDRKSTEKPAGSLDSTADQKKAAYGISAPQIYRFLLEQPEEYQQELHREFFTDDHAFWPKQENMDQRMKNLQSKWGKLSRQIQLKQRRKGTEPEDGEELVSYQLRAAKSRRSYRDFLRKFMVLKEEMHIDPDEFDLGFYTYGLSLYKNLPLIEPMESRETKKIRDFVVVIDTSYSTSGTLIQGFLKETLRLLMEQNNFFRQSRLHLIQADETVQEDILLKSEEDIRKLFQDFTVKGGGGTDFRPAFQYVNRLADEGHFKDLCGLLYFTDGKGTYPKQPPAYQTAFLFLEDFEEEKIPPWAMRLKLEPDEFTAQK